MPVARVDSDRSTHYEVDTFFLSEPKAPMQRRDQGYTNGGCFIQNYLPLAWC